MTEIHNVIEQEQHQVTLRKRRMIDNEKYLQKIKIKESQNKKQMDKHPVLPKSCDGKCRKQCPLLNYEHQTTVWLNYWKLHYTDRRKYLSKCVTLAPIKRRKVKENDDYGFKKNKSRLYSLNYPELNVEISICKKTFL